MPSMDPGRREVQQQGTAEILAACGKRKCSNLDIFQHNSQLLSLVKARNSVEATHPFSVIDMAFHFGTTRDIGLRADACTGRRASRVAPSCLGSIKPRRTLERAFALSITRLAHNASLRITWLCAE
jgi:hypothetical protein